MRAGPLGRRLASPSPRLAARAWAWSTPTTPAPHQRGGPVGDDRPLAARVRRGASSRPPAVSLVGDGGRPRSMRSTARIHLLRTVGVVVAFVALAGAPMSAAAAGHLRPAANRGHHASDVPAPTTVLVQYRQGTSVL